METMGDLVRPETCRGLLNDASLVDGQRGATEEPVDQSLGIMNPRVVWGFENRVDAVAGLKLAKPAVGVEGIVAAADGVDGVPEQIVGKGLDVGFGDGGGSQAGKFSLAKASRPGVVLARRAVVSSRVWLSRPWKAGGEW